MHTLDIPNARARIFHNGDWSGDVEVLLGVNPIGHPDQDAPPTARLCIPAAVFVAVAVKMVEEASQEPTRFYQGSRVVPSRKPEHDWQYDRGAGDARRSNDGKPGVVLKTSDGHGLCYLVDHGQGGQAWWEPDELTSEETAKPGQCCAKLRESQGASIGLPSGISFCPWCGVRQTPADLTLAPGRPVYP